MCDEFHIVSYRSHGKQRKKEKKDKKKNSIDIYYYVFTLID